MKKIFSIVCFLCIAVAISAQDAYYALYKAKEWEKLEKKIIPALQKQPANVVYNHVAGMMYGSASYAGKDYDRAYAHLVAAKNEYGKLSSSEKGKYSKYVTAKKIQKELDTVCQRLYEQVIASPSVDGYTVFLKKYKRVSDSLKADVSARRNALAYNEAVTKNTVAAYQSFIDTYPSATERSSAIKRRDKLAFDDAIRKNDGSTYLAFLNAYPRSEYAPEIQKRYTTILFSDDGETSFEVYEHFVKTNPRSVMTKPTLRKMMDIAKAQSDVRKMQKTVEYSRDVDFEYALYEFYKAFTSDGESLTLYTFVDMYPRTFLDTLIAKDMKIAQRGDALELMEPYDSAKSYHVFTEYIKMAAPKEKALVVLQKLISQDVADKNWKKAIATVTTYRSYFGTQTEKVDKLLAILKAPEDKSVTIRPIGDKINTLEGGEYSPIITADNSYLFFCGKNRPDNYGGEDIFVSEREGDTWGKPKLLSNLSTPMTNEAVISVSTDGTRLLYFREGVIYESERTSYGWQPGEGVSPEINNASWSADAMITSDGNAIIFASVRDDGYNYYTKQNKSLGLYHGSIHHQSDIYVSLRTEDGWGKPINLGPTINTIYVERSPFLHHDMKTLYFSSDGHGGVGNLDVYVTTRLSDSCWDCWSEPINLGKEINTSEENWGYRIAPNGTDFYYAARETGTFQNDLMYVSIPRKYRPDVVAHITGTITDTKGKPVQTDIVWEDLSTGEVVERSQSDPTNGTYFTVLPHGKLYGYYVDDERYYPQSQNVDLQRGEEAQTITKDIVVTTYDEMKGQSAAVRLNNIFFDTDKSDLLDYSIPELRRAAKVILSSGLRVEISGHTDNIGDDAYNMSLSLRRSEAVKKFLVSEGCPESMLTVVGYGETKPSTTNDTAEGRAKNRRVEIRFY